MPGTNLIFGRTALPNTQWNGDVSQLLDLLVAHLTGTLENGALIGQIGGTEPLTDIGLWLNGNTWYHWSSTDGKYLPFPVVTGSLFGSNLYTTQLVSNAATGNITINLPDKNNGMLATLTDLATPVATITSTGSPITVNWTNIGQFGREYSNISGATTISEAGTSLDGQIIDLWIEIPPSTTITTWALTWPNTWILSSGTASLPTATTTASQREVNHFRIYRISNYTFVEFVKAFTISTTAGSAGSDTTPPTVSTITVPVSTATVTIHFSEALRGGSLDTTKWLVKRSGVTNAVVSATASGSDVTLTVTTTYSSSNTGTVQYTGTDVKDLAGNAAAVFGPSALIVAGGGGDLDPGGGGHLPP